MDEPREDTCSRCATSTTAALPIQAEALERNRGGWPLQYRGHLRCWRRDFANGIVLVNPTNSAQQVSLGGSFSMIKGVVDSTFNTGATGLTQISLPAEPKERLLQCMTLWHNQARR